MSKQSQATVTLGNITLDVYYYYEQGQPAEWPHTPPIAPSVEIRNVIYKEQPIFELLTEVDSELFWGKLEAKILEGHDKN